MHILQLINVGIVYSNSVKRTALDMCVISIVAFQVQQKITCGSYNINVLFDSELQLSTPNTCVRAVFLELVIYAVRISSNRQVYDRYHTFMSADFATKGVSCAYYQR